jgi:hypothetical protein
MAYLRGRAIVEILANPICRSKVGLWHKADDNALPGRGQLAGVKPTLLVENDRRKREKDRRFRGRRPTYEGGEFLGAVARLDITDHTTPIKTANAPAMVVHSSDVK